MNYRKHTPGNLTPLNKFESIYGIFNLPHNIIQAYGTQYDIYELIITMSVIQDFY